MTLGETRTYDTAEKVVPLPAPHRIAVLHAGRVRIGNLPYSVFVAEWIRQLGPKPLRNAEAYQLSFQDWLSNNQQWFTADMEKSDVLEFIENRARALVNTFNRVRSNQPDFEIDELLTAWTAEVMEIPRLESTTADAARVTFSKYSTEFDEIFEGIISPVVTGEHLKEAFTHYCANLFSSSWMTNSTLTFAGYGEFEIYPSFTIIQVHGFIDNQLRWVKGHSWSLSPKDDPVFAITMPAQRDAIDSYLRGYDEDMISALIERADSEKAELLSMVRRKFDGDDEIQRRIDDAVNDVMKDFESGMWDTVSNYSEEKYIENLRIAIAALPAASLVDVARSLIELQALRKTTTAQADTVGGPIDVGLITPADGFVWVRHKSIG